MTELCIHGFFRDGFGGLKCALCVPYDTTLSERIALAMEHNIHQNDSDVIAHEAVAENLLFRKLLSECATFLRTSPVNHMDGQIMIDLINKIEAALVVK